MWAKNVKAKKILNSRYGMTVTDLVCEDYRYSDTDSVKVCNAESRVLSRICEYMRMERASGRCGEIQARQKYNAGLRGLIEGLMLSFDPEYVCDLVSKARQIVNKEMDVGTDEG